MVDILNEGFWLKPQLRPLWKFTAIWTMPLGTISRKSTETSGLVFNTPPSKLSMLSVSFCVFLSLSLPLSSSISLFFLSLFLSNLNYFK